MSMTQHTNRLQFTTWATTRDCITKIQRELCWLFNVGAFQRLFFSFCFYSSFPSLSLCFSFFFFCFFSYSFVNLLFLHLLKEHRIKRMAVKLIDGAVLSRVLEALKLVWTTLVWLGKENARKEMGTETRALHFWPERSVAQNCAKFAVVPLSRTLTFSTLAARSWRGKRSSAFQV